MMSFIENDVEFKVERKIILKMICLLSKIHNLFSKLDFKPKHKIKGFHDRRYYFENLKVWYRKENKKNFKFGREVFEFIEKNFDVDFFENLKDFQIIHGDCRFDNFLYDSKKDTIYIVDIDTIMKGSVYLDVGDFCRSISSKIDYFDERLLKEIFDEYNKFSKKPLDYDIYLSSIKQIGLELMVRYFTDYLGDNYFKILENKEKYLEDKIKQLQKLCSWILNLEKT